MQRQNLRASLAIIPQRFHLMASGSKDRSIASTSIDHHLIKFLREFYRPQIFADAEPAGFQASHQDYKYINI